MYPGRPSFHQSITAKLLMLCLLTLLVFSALAAIMISAFGDIEQLTNTIITRDVNRIIQNSQLARDLSGVLTETNLLVSTFYGHDNVLEKERTVITSGIDTILLQPMEAAQRDILTQFRTSLTQVLQQCKTINTHHAKIVEKDRILHELLTQLEGIISQKIVDLVLAGDDSLAYEQIGALIPSYRETLLRANLSFREQEPAQAAPEDAGSITDLLDNLHLRLRTLLASDAEVSDYGRQLLAGIVLYRKAIIDFQQDSMELQRELDELNTTREQTLATMQKADDLSANAAQLMKKEINSITESSENSVVSIATVVAILFGIFIYFFLLRNIHKPMESIRRGIESVREGDLQTRIQLGRKDEWHIIENALNQMTEDLFESYNKLQKNNEELARTQDDMAQNMRVLEEEIRQREQAEEKTEQLQHQLQHAQKMEAIGTLAGGIAHDFNNLLQGIQGYCELLLFKNTDQPPRDMQEILRAAKRGGELTRQLLTFSRKVESNLAPIDLNQVISDMRDMLERTIPKMIKVKLHLKTNLSFVKGDSSQLEQVLMNLAVNARDAMPEGGLLTIGTEDVVLDPQYHLILPEIAPGPYVLLTVSDTGQGMDLATQNRIFDPFFTTKSVGKGTGLGLAIVYGIVKNHQGHITCYSEPAKGTAFKVYLQAITHNAATIREEAADDMPRGTETILLIDDEVFIREIGQRILKEFGYTVLTAEDGERALEIYQKDGASIDLIILDIIMPGMGGEQCLKKLIAAHAQVKIVIASGYSANGPVSDTMLRGAQDFINKPYDVGQLLRTVRRVLDTTL